MCTPVKDRIVYMPALFMLVLGLFVLGSSVGMRFGANRPDLFPFAWWISGFVLFAGVFMLCFAAALNRRRRQQMIERRLYDDYGHPWAKKW